MRKKQSFIRTKWFRNLTLAVIVADGAGIYAVQHRLSQAPADEAPGINDDQIAAAASDVRFSPVVPQARPASELPQPAFGQGEPKMANAASKAQPAPKVEAAPKAIQAPHFAVAPAPVQAPVRAVVAPAKASPVKAAPVKMAAAPRANVKPRPFATAPWLARSGERQVAQTAKPVDLARVVQPARQASAKVPTTLSATPKRQSKSARFAASHVRKHTTTTFAHAFADLAQPDLATATAGLNVPSDANSVSLQFAADQTRTVDTAPPALLANQDVPASSGSELPAITEPVPAKVR